LWRHGGVVFGPHPRDFSINIPPKIKNLALRSVLSAKVKENNLVILDEFKINEAKTKFADKVFSNLKLKPGKKDKFNVLFLMTSLSKEIFRPLANIDFVSIGLARDAHTYEVLTHKKILITKDGLRQLTDRLKS
jgi:large subunit ribosomal protein L4